MPADETPNARFVRAAVRWLQRHGLDDPARAPGAVAGLAELGWRRPFGGAPHPPLPAPAELTRHFIFSPRDADAAACVTPLALAGLVEALQAGSRRSRGVYYTPPEIVDYMAGRALDALQPTPISLVGWSALDPACGGGAFLCGLLEQLTRRLARLDPDNRAWRALQVARAGSAEARRRVQQIFDHPNPDTPRRYFLMQRLYGVEPHPLALAVTRWRLALSLPPDCPPPPLHLHRGDALLELPPGWPSTYRLVLGNPPYVRLMRQSAAARSDLRARFTTLERDFDLYVAFIERALQLLAPGGLSALLTPDKFLVRAYGERLRALLLQRRIVEFYDLSRAVDSFGAAVYPLISLVKNEPPQGGTCLRFASSMRRLDSPQAEYWLDQSRWRAEDGLALHAPAAAARLTAVYAGGQGTLADLIPRRELFCGTPRAAQYHRWAAGLVSGERPGTLRVLTCAGVQPYQIHPGGMLRVLGCRLSDPYFDNSAGLIPAATQASFLRAPRLLIRATGRFLTAAYDPQGGVPVGLYVLPLDGALRPWGLYLLALLNSRLMRHVYADRNASARVGGGYFSITAPSLLALPWREPPSALHVEIDRLAATTLANPAAEVEALARIDALLDDLYGVDSSNWEEAEGL